MTTQKSGKSGTGKTGGQSSTGTPAAKPMDAGTGMRPNTATPQPTTGMQANTTPVMKPLMAQEGGEAS